MNSHELLTMLHIALALFSGFGFALRGFIRLILKRRLASPLIRFGPHLLDTLLLFSGAGLWWLTGYSPLTAGWFGVKLILIVVYIGIGIHAFRTSNGKAAVRNYLIAMGVFLTIIWLALFKPL